MSGYGDRIYFSFTADALDGVVQYLFSGKAQPPQAFIQANTDEIRLTFTKLATGSVTITGPTVLAGTKYSGYVEFKADGVDLVVNGTAYSSPETPLVVAEELKIIAANNQWSGYFQGTIHYLKYINATPLQNTNAVQGNGVDLWGSIPEITLTGEFLVSGWLERTDNTGTAQTTVCGQAASTDNRLRLYDSGHATLADDIALSINGSSLTWSAAAANIDQDQHVFIEIERDSSDDVDLRLDGVSQGTVNLTGDFVTNSLGQGNSADYNNGILYDLKITDQSGAEDVVYQYDLKGDNGDTIPNIDPVSGVVSYAVLAGGRFSTPDSASGSVTSDIDIRAHVALDDWTPSSDSEAIVSKYSTTSQQSYILNVKTSGELQLVTSSTGEDVIASQSSVVLPGAVDGVAEWVRVTLDISTDTAKYYTSDDGMIWDQLGTDVSHVSSGIFDSTSPIEIGAFDSGTDNKLSGKIYRAQIYDGIEGTLVIDFDPTEYVSGTTWMSSATGEIWTRNGNAMFNHFGLWQNYDSVTDQVAMPQLSRHYKINDGPDAPYLEDSLSPVESIITADEKLLVTGGWTADGAGTIDDETHATIAVSAGVYSASLAIGALPGEAIRFSMTVTAITETAAGSVKLRLQDGAGSYDGSPQPTLTVGVPVTMSGIATTAGGASQTVIRLHSNGFAGQVLIENIKMERLYSAAELHNVSTTDWEK